ncbi:unnamed protein product [Ectocarpus sp. CCAP 1310/34]|nr:unnamed protein product [Ectocarpus sp. CCAP 1310/34]
MAAPSSGRQSRTLCTFYEKGSCRYGASCRFTHGTSDSRELRADGAAGETQTPGQAKPTASTSSKEPCRFFAKGKCVRGASCRFFHSATGSDDSREGDSDETGRRTRSSSGKATPNGGCAEGDEDRGQAVTTAKRSTRPCPSPSRQSTSASAAAVAGDSRVRPEGVCEKRGDAGCCSSKKSGGSSGGDEMTGRLQRSWTDIATEDVPIDAGGGTASSASTASTQSGTSCEENDGDAEEPIAPARRKLAANAADKRDRNTARPAAAAAGNTSAPAPGASAPLGQRRTQPVGGSYRGEIDRKGKQEKQACVFFARGRCRYGDRCRFSHDAVEETPAAGAGGERGSHGGRGGGSVGRKEKRGVASEPSSHASEGFGEDEVAAREAALDEAERIQSRSAECGICLGKVRKLGKVKDRVFGILVSCKHIYCLGCIQEWRDKSNNHACPECGLSSSLALPSKTFVTDLDRKKRLALELRQSPRGTPSGRRL